MTLHIYAEDYDPLKSWQLATWCKKHGANEWTISSVTVRGAGTTLFERFEEAAQRFHLPKAKRRQLTARRKVDGLWNFTSWFEDPVFYRNGEFMLGVVSHENEGLLRVTQVERRMLEAKGFPFRPFGSYVGC